MGQGFMGTFWDGVALLLLGAHITRADMLPEIDKQTMSKDVNA